MQVSLMWHPPLLSAAAMQGSCSDNFAKALYTFADFMMELRTLLIEVQTIVTECSEV